MKLAFVTNLRAPYRTLQLNNLASIDEVVITAYYSHNKSDNRVWDTGLIKNFNEVDLNGWKVLNNLYINTNILKILKDNDVIMIGGYDQPTYIFLSFLCKILKKQYILLFDGISTNRLRINEKWGKKVIKKSVINGATCIFGNGTVSKLYFKNKFNFDENKIINQYLTIDTDKINSLYKSKTQLRELYREKLNISNNQKVILYSGRLIDIKNVQVVIRALSIIENKDDFVFLITGGGELEEDLKNLAAELGVKLIITGFMSNQEELFKHYFAADLFILPSLDEPWGLVVNEAMCVGLPILVSDICGCSLDLVDEGRNGYLIEPTNIFDISYKIKRTLEENKNGSFGDASRRIIKDWTYNNSKDNFEKIIKNILKRRG